MVAYCVEEIMRANLVIGTRMRTEDCVISTELRCACVIDSEVLEYYVCNEGFYIDGF